MRVLLDVSAVPDQLTGAGVYTTELTRALAHRDDVEVVLVARTDDTARWEELAPHAELHAVVPVARPLRLAWEQVAAPRFARRVGGEVWHGPHYTMPVRVGAPAVVTVHDLTFFDHPEWHERSKVLFFRRAIAASARRAAVIVCVSEATAVRLHELAPPVGRVVVIHHGVDTTRFSPRDDDNARHDTARLAAFGIEPPYLAFVGTLEPRKNLPGLVEAFACIATESPRLRLVLAGKPGWGADAVDRAIAENGVADRVVCPGYLPDDALPALLRRAEAVVYPSHEEGFGLPPLEAMACGTPVLTTADVVTAELARGAVLTAGAGVAALADGLRRVLRPEEAARLRTAGSALVGQFSWSSAAAAHARAYSAALGHEPVGGPDPGR